MIQRLPPLHHFETNIASAYQSPPIVGSPILTIVVLQNPLVMHRARNAQPRAGQPSQPAILDEPRRSSAALEAAIDRQPPNGEEI